MRLPGKRSVVVALTLASAVLALGLPGSAFAEDCSEVDAWVKANADQLPSDYEGIVRHPVAYRKAIFSTLSVENQVKVWKQHLEQYLASHPQLNARQVAFIRQTLARLSPKLFERRSERRGEADPLVQLKADASAVFSSEEVTQLLATLGPAEDAAAPQVYYCPCSTYSDYCPTFTFCTLGTSCTPRTTGCGTFYQYPCNGDCLY